MTFLRNVLHDLVEKKLWPIAVALVVALVAVPLVLAGGGGDKGSDAADVAAAPATSPNANATPAKGAAKVVSLDTTVSDGPVTRPGKVRDPFVQHHLPKDTSAASQASSTTAPPTTSTPSGSAGSGGSSASPTTPIGPSTTPPKTDKPAGPPSDVSTVTIKLGTDKLEQYRWVQPLRALPSADNPKVIFLGLSEDGKGAIFLLDEGTTATGDGTCRPDPDSCEQIELKKGDIEFLQVTNSDGQPVEYQLEVLALHAVAGSTAATAAKAHAAVVSDLLALGAGTPVVGLPAGLADAAQGQPAGTQQQTFTVPAP